jgi:hypothetical protein
MRQNWVVQPSHAEEPRMLVKIIRINGKLAIASAAGYEFVEMFGKKGEDPRPALG